MIRLDNPELDIFILNHLAETYKLKEKREGIHLSTLVYCLTKSFFDQQSPIEPTDEELMLFALGYALQDVMTPEGAETPIYEADGIVFRPDFYLPYSNELCEIKTTRASLKTNMKALPETWIEYIMGGCHMRGKTEYQLSVLYLMGNYAPPFPLIHSETLMFTGEELDNNWQRLLERKSIYEKSLILNVPPEPFKYCKDWECKNCRYKLMCEALASMSKVLVEAK